MLIKLRQEEELFSFLRHNREKLIIIKFSATWCAPCQQLHLTLRKLLRERKDLVVIEVEVEKFPRLTQSSDFQVLSIPTLVLFYQGEMKKKAVGNLTMEQLKEFLAFN